MYYILHFKEANFPTGDKPFEKRILVDGISSFKQAYEVLEEIKELKEGADEEGVFDGIYNWNEYGWEEKIEMVCDYVSNKEDFKIITTRTVETSIN